MTIKNTDKNVSAENHEVVADVTYSNNGILTIVRKNLYSDTEVENKNVDLSDHKLKLRVLEDETELRALETSDDETDIKDRQLYVFLVPFENSGEEGVYREYIWVEDEHDVNGGEFEVIGSTKTDLEPYFKKSDIANNVTTTEEGKALDARQGKVLNDGLTNLVNTVNQTFTSIYSNFIQKNSTSGLVKNDGSIDTTSYASDSELSSAINNLGNFLGGKITTLEQLKIIKSNGNYYLDVSGAQKGVTIEIPDITGKEDVSNKVTTISSSSTNTQYPSAKAVYDELPKTTKTLTVTYTNGTTEDIEFYIK